MAKGSVRAWRPVRAACWVAAVLLAGCGALEQEAPAPPVEGLRVAQVLGAEGTDGFAEAQARRTFQFPADHAAHLPYRSEWWYLTYALTTAGGREFGVQFTLFRRALFVAGDGVDPWRNGQVYLAHFAVTDVAAGLHRESERLARAHPALAGVQLQSARVTAWLEDWRLVLDAGSWALDVAQGGAAVKLEMHPSKPVVLHGDAGLSAKGPGQASYYYSVPRLHTAGQVEIDGEQHAVTGLGWLDREWSTSALSPGQVGWNWFALMLHSGEDLMAFQMRREDGSRDPFDYGVWIEASGKAQQLAVEDFRLTPLGYWRDGEGREWPTVWRLMLPDRQFEIRASLEDQRMDTLLTYWEGLVKVTDDNGRDVGRGYMELTGY